MTNKIELPIFIDNKKLLDFKVKDLNSSLEEFRESLNGIIPEYHVFCNKDGSLICSDLEECTKLSDVLKDGGVYFKSQDSISQDVSLQAKTTRSINVKSHPEFEISSSDSPQEFSNDNDSLQVLPSPDFMTIPNISNNIVSQNDEDTSSIGDVSSIDGASNKKRIWLKNINVEENRKTIVEYCNNLPLKSSIDISTFTDGNEIVQWDIKNALLFPPQETMSFITKSTFNSVEHNAHKGGLYSWNGTLALKSIFGFVHKGQIENETSNNNLSKTVYSYTHGMISRLEIRIEPEYISLKDGFIKSLEESSEDLNVLKQFLKVNEFFPTRFILGGKISSTGHKIDCTESDKESFGFSLENRFKFSFHDPVDLDFGFNANHNNQSSDTITGSYSFDEKRVCGGDSTLKDQFDQYILSLENIQDCSIIEIGNLTPIWTLLQNQNKQLYDKCVNLLNSEEQTLNIQVYSKVGSDGYSKFIINGKEIDCGHNQGFNVVLLDSKGLNLDSKSFNTSSIFFFFNSSRKFAQYLNSIKDGKIILLSVNGDGFSSLSDLAKKALVNLGIERVEFFESNSSFCAILKKGDKDSVVQNSKDSSVAYCEKKFIVNKN